VVVVVIVVDVVVVVAVVIVVDVVAVVAVVIVVDVVAVVVVVLGGCRHLVRSPSSRQAPRMGVRHARLHGRRHLLLQALAGRPESEAHALCLQSATALRQGPMHSAIAGAQSLAQGFLPGNA